MRLFLACVDLAGMLAPIMAAGATIAVTLFWWPGAMPGLIVLTAIGCLAASHRETVSREHHS